MAATRGTAAWRGASDEASGLYDDVAERVHNALPVIRRHARDIEETIRDNPARAGAPPPARPSGGQTHSGEHQ